MSQKYLQLKIFALGYDGTILYNLDKMATIIAQSLRFLAVFCATLETPATPRLMSLAIGFAEYRIREDRRRVQTFQLSSGVFTARHRRQEGYFDELMDE